MKRTIQYAFHKDDGHVVSRVGDHVACPILEYEKIGEGGDFTRPFTYHLEKFNVFAMTGVWDQYTWTRKIPTQVKNLHRVFWGLKPLVASPHEGRQPRVY